MINPEGHLDRDEVLRTVRKTVKEMHRDIELLHRLAMGVENGTVTLKKLAEELRGIQEHSYGGEDG